MRKFAFVLFLLVNFPAWASISGQLKSTTDVYPHNFGPPTQTVVPYVSLELNDKYKISRNTRAQWKLYALTNTVSKYSPEKFYGDIPEALVEMRRGTGKLKLGINTLNWGVVDVSSPSDVVNTQAIFHPLRTSKQGAPMVDVSFGPETFNLNLVYIPVQRAPVLPSKDSRWLPRELLIDEKVAELNNNSIIFPKTIEYEYTKMDTQSHALNHNAGAKLSSHIGSWDLQVVHFQGAAPSPKIKPLIRTFFNDLISPVPLTQVNYRIRTTGFGFVWAREKWIWRGESAYSHTISEDPYLPPWSWQSVLEAETNIDLGSSTLTVVMLGYYTQNPKEADNNIGSAYRIFDRTAVLAGRWAYSENLTIMLSGLWETQTNGLFAMGSFDYKLSDHLKWGLTWRNFSAQKPGLLKTYAKDSHGSMELTYFF